MTISALFFQFFAEFQATSIGCNLRFEIILDFEEYFQYKDCDLPNVNGCASGLSIVFYEYPPYVFCSQRNCQKPVGLLVGELKFSVILITVCITFLLYSSLDLKHSHVWRLYLCNHTDTHDDCSMKHTLRTCKIKVKVSL